MKSILFIWQNAWKADHFLSYFGSEDGIVTFQKVFLTFHDISSHFSKCTESIDLGLAQFCQEMEYDLYPLLVLSLAELMYLDSS